MDTYYGCHLITHQKTFHCASRRARRSGGVGKGWREKHRHEKNKRGVNGRKEKWESQSERLIERGRAVNLRSGFEWRTDVEGVWVVE